MATITNDIAGQQLVSWPVESLRRYGVNNWCFTIDTGRYLKRWLMVCGIKDLSVSDTVARVRQGSTSIALTAGWYTARSIILLWSSTAPRIREEHLQYVNNDNNYHLLYLSLQPESMLSSRSLTSVSQQAINMPHPQSSHTPYPPSTISDMSPPQYNHIQHNLQPTTSHEPYSLINSSMTTPTSNYDKLNHTLIHSQTDPVLHHCNSVDEANIYSNIQEMKGEANSDDDRSGGDSPIMFVSDQEKAPPIPPRPSPPIPPRPPKMTTIWAHLPHITHHAHSTVWLSVEYLLYQVTMLWFYIVWICINLS